MFAKNVGSADRIVRMVVRIVPLVTGLFSTCPLYSLFGMSTCPMKKVR